MPLTDRNSPNYQAPKNTSRLTEELVQKVADRVYELWRQDARIEAERQRLFRSRWKRR